MSEFLPRLIPLKTQVFVTERKAIIEALAYTGGDRKKAAMALDIPKRTLYYKLRKMGLND